MNKNYAKYIFFTLVFFITANVVFQIAIVDNPNFNVYDLAMNLLSELAGMLFTVLIFNEFISYRQRLTMQSKNKILLKELEELYKEIYFTFSSAVNKCAGGSFSGELWTVGAFEMIREKIKLTEIEDNTFPPVPWYLFFSMQGEKLMRKCENIRLQYQDILEPQTSYFLFFLINQSQMLSDLMDIKKIYEIDLLTKYERPGNLGSYFACPTERDFESIRKFDEWLADSNSNTEIDRRRGAQYHKYIRIICPCILAVVSVKYFFDANYYLAGLSLVGAALYVTIPVYFRRKKNKQ